MKFSAVLAIAAATGYVSAQDLSKLPQCSLSCLLTGVTATGCSTTDLKCSCNKSSQLTASVTPCIQQSCSPADQAKTITALEDLCAQAGVAVTLTPPSGGSSSTPASSTPASSAPASSASAPAGYGSAVSSAVSVASSVAASSVASSAAVTTAAPSSVPSAATNATLPTSIYTGGAAAATGLPVAMAALAGALYLL